MCGEARGFVLEDNFARKVEGVFCEPGARMEGKEVGYVFILLEAFAIPEIMFAQDTKLKDVIELTQKTGGPQADILECGKS